MKRNGWRPWLATWAFAAGLVAWGCDGSSPTSPAVPSPPLPSWAAALITEIESQPVTNPPSSLYRYRYHGETVYFRPARCCDVSSDLFDRAGSVLCHPDGGLSGSGDGRCTDFFEARSAEELLWHDPRD
jgi:hypothetical protein